MWLKSTLEGWVVFGLVSIGVNYFQKEAHIPTLGSRESRGTSEKLKEDQ